MASDPKIAIRLEAVTRQFRDGINRAREALGRLGRDGERAGDELNTGFSKARRGVESISRQLEQTRKLMRNLTAAYGAFKAASSVFESAADMEGLNASMKAVAGSSEAAAREFAFVRREAERLGLPLAEATRQYLGLMAAARGTQLEGEGIRRVFSAISEAAVVLNMSNDDLAGSLNAIQQMISKGTVSAEELRQQLGERLYGAFQIAARSVNVATKDLDKALQRGLLNSEEFLIAFAAQIRKEFGGSVDEASQTARRALNRLDNAFLELKLQLAEGGFLDAVVQSMRELTEIMKDPAVIQGARDLGHYLGELIRLIARHADKIDNVIGAFMGLRVGAAFGPWGALAGMIAGAGLPDFLLPEGGEPKASAGKPSLEQRIRALRRQIDQIESRITTASERERARLEAFVERQKAALAQLEAQAKRTGESPTADKGAQAAAARIRAQLKKAGIIGGDTGNNDSQCGDTKKTDQARASLQRLEQTLQRQIATFGQSARAVLRYRLTLGDLAEEARKLGPEGEAMRQQLLEMLRALEGLDKAKSAREALADAREKAREARATARGQLDSLSADLRQQIALFGKDGPTAVLRYRLTLGDLAEAVKRLGPEGETLRQGLLAQIKTLEDKQRLQQAADKKAAEKQRLQQEGAALTERLRTAQERYNAAIAHYKKLLAAEAIDQTTFNRAKKAAQKRLEEATKNTRQATDAMNQYAISAARGMQQAFADYLFNPFDKGLKGMLRGFIDVLRRMLAEALAAQLGQKMFGDYGKTGQLGGWIGGVLASLFHSGGIAGTRAASRTLPPLALALAPRYHRGGIAGLAPDEVPAILRRGEEVLTRNDPRHRRNGGGVGNVIVHVDATGGAVEGEGQAAELGRQIAAAVRGVLINERRPGGLLAGAV